MSEKSEKLQATLARLSKMSKQNSGSGSGMKFYKVKKGKNNLIILPTPMTEDPFLEWGVHKNLLDVAWKDVPCNKHNKNEECLVCQVIEDLQKDNWKGNFPIWKPIEKKIRYFSPIVDLDDIKLGVQWWGYGKSVLSQLENWMTNLEDEETPFYELESLEKVIVSYDPDADPSLMYKLDKKNLPANLVTMEQLEAWVASVKPLVELMTFELSEEKLAEALDDYTQAIQQKLEEEAANPKEETSETEEPTKQEEPAKEVPVKPSKLSTLKKDSKK